MTVSKRHLPTALKMNGKLQNQHVVFLASTKTEILRIALEHMGILIFGLLGRHNRVYIKMGIINKKVLFNTKYLAFRLFLVYSNRAFAHRLCTDLLYGIFLYGGVVCANIKHSKLHLKSKNSQ